jgi:hypothetical protein
MRISPKLELVNEYLRLYNSPPGKGRKELLRLVSLEVIESKLNEKRVEVLLEDGEIMFYDNRTGDWIEGWYLD